MKPRNPNKYRDNNLDAARARERAYVENNRDRIRAYQKAWREANIDHVKQYEKDNSEYISARTRRWQKANRDRHLEIVTNYQKRHIDRVIDSRATRHKKQIGDLNWVINDKLTRAKHRAKNKGFDFDLTTEYLQSIYPVDGKCPIFNTPFDMSRSNIDYTMSIDRIDNTKGYIVGNVWFISTRANLLKRDRTIDELWLTLHNMETGKMKVRRNARYTLDELRLVVEGLDRKINEMNRLSV